MKRRALRLVCLVISHNWMICDCYVQHNRKASTSPFICSRCKTRDGDN